jgi:hypothetical protein
MQEIVLQVEEHLIALRRGRVVNIPASYSGGPEFYSRPKIYLDWDFSCIFSVPLDEFRGSSLKLGHDRCLPTPFKFIIHLSPYFSTLHSLSHWKSVVKYNTNTNNATTTTATTTTTSTTTTTTTTNSIQFNSLF